MKKYLPEYKLPIYILVILFLVGAISDTFFVFGCFANSCDISIVRGVIKPVIWFSVCLAPIVAFFLFIPSTYFKKWLLYITTWYLPLTLYIASNTKPLGGSILSPSRSEAVIYMMMILGVITIIFLGVQWLIFRRQKKI